MAKQSLTLENIGYTFRTFSLHGETAFVGCHYLTDLKIENPQKIWADYCVFLVLQGEGIYTDWNGNTYPLQAGWVAQHVPGKWHRVQRAPHVPWVEVSLSMSRALFDMFSALGLINAACPVVQTRNMSSLKTRFRELRQALQTRKEQDMPHMLVLTQALLWDIFGTVNVRQESSAHPAMIHDICDFLRRNLAASVDWEALSAQCHMSYSHFRRVFREQMGMSPGQYRIAQRMEQACLALKDGQRSIKQIAAELGYSDPFVFSRQFSKHIGCSPRQYRQPFF